jgi:hypothetical protein
MLDDARDEQTRQVDHAQDDGDGVRRAPGEEPSASARAGELEREVERGGRRETDADPEHAAPELGDVGIVEVREPEDREVPGRDRERHRGERALERIAEPAAQDDGADDGFCDRGAERDSPFVAHGSSRFLGSEG